MDRYINLGARPSQTLPLAPYSRQCQQEKQLSFFTSLNTYLPTYMCAIFEPLLLYTWIKVLFRYRVSFALLEEKVSFSDDDRLARASSLKLNFFWGREITFLRNYFFFPGQVLIAKMSKSLSAPNAKFNWTSFSVRVFGWVRCFDISLERCPPPPLGPIVEGWWQNECSWRLREDDNCMRLAARLQSFDLPCRLLVCWSYL